LLNGATLSALRASAVSCSDQGGTSSAPKATAAATSSSSPGKRPSNSVQRHLCRPAIRGGLAARDMSKAPFHVRNPAAQCGLPPYLSSKTQTLVKFTLTLEIPDGPPKPFGDAPSSFHD
jgi:hypothetical protein